MGSDEVVEDEFGERGGGHHWIGSRSFVWKVGSAAWVGMVGLWAYYSVEAPMPLSVSVLDLGLLIYFFFSFFGFKEIM